MTPTDEQIELVRAALAETGVFGDAGWDSIDSQISAARAAIAAMQSERARRGQTHCYLCGKDYDPVSSQEVAYHAHYGGHGLPIPVYRTDLPEKGIEGLATKVGE